MKKGKFIVIEGIDGAGLFTQSAMLAQHLKDTGRKVFLTKEPTSSIIGGLAKSAIDGDFSISAKTLQILFSADRAHHLEKEIEPAIERGETVVCDRYIFSSLAYGFVSQVNYKWLRAINLNFRLPDIGILLDVAPSTALNRIYGEDMNLQLFDDKDKISRVRQTYLHISKEFHLKRVDGNADIASVSSKINGVIDRLIKK